MSERINRRDLIVRTAASLFIKHGYSATSVRQIAEDVGVTEAALYYHFKDGKRELLQAVVEANMPDLSVVLKGCGEEPSLRSFMHCFGANLTRNFRRDTLDRLRWLGAEFPLLNEDEKTIFHQMRVDTHASLAALLARYLPDEETAEGVAWALLCALMGYGHMFISMELEQVTSFTLDDLLMALVNMLETQYDGDDPN